MKSSGNFPVSPATAIGLTGGVACGKTLVAELLAEWLGARVFLSDRAVHGLLGEEGAVRSAVEAAFPQTVDASGISRALLRDLVFSDDEARKRLEGILHPAVRALWLGELRRARADGAIFVAEIPLLFEVKAERSFDMVVAVLCSRDIQIDRLVNSRGLSAVLAERMIATQMPTEDKAAMANVVIWNDGDLEALHSQVRLLADRIRPQEIVAQARVDRVICRPQL